MGSGAGRRLVVVSPHLDDAVLSLGAGIAAAVRAGHEVVVLTVLGGDPGSTAPADESNRRAGFTTVGAAARTRREEDRRACLRLGATAVWLPFDDDASATLPAQGDLWAAVLPVVTGADLVLLPGWPLSHPHHRWVADSLRPALTAAGLPVAAYVEQPYASWLWAAKGTGAALLRRPRPEPAALVVPVANLPPRPGPGAHLAKYRACREYASQLRVLRRAPVARIAAYELRAGGERLLGPPPVAALHVGPARSDVGGMSSVLNAYAGLPVRARLAFTASYHSGAKAFGVVPFLRSAAGVLRAPRSTVVHVHLSHGGSYVREGALVALAHRTGHPTVATLHGSGFVSFAQAWPRLVRAVLGRTDTVAVLGPSHRDFLARALPAVRTVVLPNPSPSAGRLAPLPPVGLPVVLFAGQVGRRKGVDLLLQAWPGVRAQLPGSELRIAGPAGDVAPVDADGVTWLGGLTQAELEPELARCRAVVLPSRQEVQPMFLLEAMTAGRPVVATDVGDVLDLVGDGGLVVPAEDVAALQAALVRLLGDPDLAAAAGLRAAERAHRRHGAAQVARQLDELYASVSARRRALAVP